MRSEPLAREQHGKQGEGDRQHERLQPRLRCPEPFYRRDDADRRGDRPVAEEERHPEYPHQDQGRLPGPAFQAQAQDKRDQSHDAALAPVVRAHDEGHVLDRDDQDDRPDNQRDHPVHPCHVRPDAAHREDGAHRVQGTRADIAENDAERAESQGRRGGTRRAAGALPPVTPRSRSAPRLAPGCRGSCACRPGFGQRAGALRKTGIHHWPASHDGVSVGSGPMTT